MTSDDVAGGLLDQLNYVGGSDGAILPPEFAFALDFDSARAWPDLPYDTASPVSRYALESRPQILLIIEEAANLFRSRAPKAWIFVNRELEGAMIRRSSAVNGASSSSNRELVGTCLLTNLDLSPDPAVFICAEALVHEAIHQHLYRIELQKGPFCDLDDAGRYRSPWSGNRIPLHSLIHASLVWFGVLSLWCQLARSCANENEALSVRSRVAPTLFGFAFIRQIVDSPAFPRGSVAPKIVELIGHIANVATAAQPPRDERAALGDFLQRSEKGEWVTSLVSGLEHVERSWHA